MRWPPSGLRGDASGYYTTGRPACPQPRHRLRPPPALALHETFPVHELLQPREQRPQLPRPQQEVVLHGPPAEPSLLRRERFEHQHPTRSHGGGQVRPPFLVSVAFLPEVLAVAGHDPSMPPKRCRGDLKVARRRLSLFAVSAPFGKLRGSGGVPCSLLPL